MLTTNYHWHFYWPERAENVKTVESKHQEYVIHGSPFVNKRFSHLYALFCCFIGKRSQAHIGCIYKADQSHSDYQKVMSSPSNLTLHLPPRRSYNSTGCILFFIVRLSYGAACFQPLCANAPFLMLLVVGGGQGWSHGTGHGRMWQYCLYKMCCETLSVLVDTDMVPLCEIQINWFATNCQKIRYTFNSG